MAMSCEFSQRCGWDLRLIAGNYLCWEPAQSVSSDSSMITACSSAGMRPKSHERIDDENCFAFGCIGYALVTASSGNRMEGALQRPRSHRLETRRSRRDDGGERNDPHARRHGLALLDWWKNRQLRAASRVSHAG